MCCEGENSLSPPFLSQWKREKDSGTVPVIFQSWAGLRTERSFQIQLSGFGDDRGNPVKGDLSTFHGFCYDVPSVHITVDECFHILDQITIADHCLGLSILEFPCLSSWNWDEFLAYSRSEISFTTAWTTCFYLILLCPYRQNQERVF